jgi:hypothetical protein
MGEPPVESGGSIVPSRNSRSLGQAVAVDQLIMATEGSPRVSALHNTTASERYYCTFIQYDVNCLLISEKQHIFIAWQKHLPRLLR